MTPLAGSRVLPFSPSHVAASLSDAAFLVASLGRVEQVIESSPDRAVWKTRLGSGLFSSSVLVTLAVTAREASSARFTAVSKGAGGGGTAEMTLQFHPVDAGTEVRYDINVVERTGFLKIVSQSIIHAAATAVMDEMWPAIARKLAAGT